MAGMIYAFSKLQNFILSNIKSHNMYKYSNEVLHGKKDFSINPR